MICSCVNFLRFMSVSFDGEQTNLKMPMFRIRMSRESWPGSRPKLELTIPQFA